MRLLRKLLPIEPGEELKIAQFALLGLLLQAGLAIGVSAADSAFLAKAGADKLPRIYLLVPAMMLVYVPAFSSLQIRWGMDRVFDLTLGALVAGGAALWLVFAHAGAGALWPCYAAKLYAALWYVGLYTLFWNFVDGYFDLYQAKRVFALFAAGSASGAILGGCLVGPLSRRFGVETLFLAWSACAAAAWPVALWIRRTCRRLEAADEEGGEESPALTETFAVIGRLLRNRFALVLTLVLFLTLIAATTCEFQYLGIFAAGRDEAGIAGLLGRLTALVNVFNLGISLFVFNPLVKRLGVRNVALIQSLAYAAVFSWLLLDGGFPAAVAGFFAYQGLMTAVDFNNANLLFSGLPAEHAKPMRTAIEGLCEPLATAAAGFMLLLVAPRLSPEQVSLAGVGVALAGLALAFVLRADYVAAIGANLRRDWLDLSRAVEPLWRAAGPADLELAEARVRAAGPNEAVLGLRLLAAGDPPRAARALPGFLRATTAESRQAVQPLLDELLADPVSPAAQEIHRWLEVQVTNPEPELAGEFGRHRLLPARQTEALLRMPGPEARGAAAATLWQSWRVADSRQALLQVEELLAAGSERSVTAGLRALGQLGEPRYAYFLRDYLKFPAGNIRQAALGALRALATPSARVLVPEILAVLREDAAAERMPALDALERIGDSDALGPVLASAHSFTPAERRRLERLILHLGPRAVPTLVEALQEPRQSWTGRSVALRALGKLALPQLHLLMEPLATAAAGRAYLFLAAGNALEQGGLEEAGRAVLARICRDYPADALEHVLEILAVAGRLPDYETLVAALRGVQSKDRGYAIEAVEQACDRRTFALLLPLLDGRSVAEQVAFARARRIVQPLSDAEVLARALEAGPPLAAAAAAQALLAQGGPEAAAQVLARVARDPHLLLAETATAWLARKAGTAGPGDPPPPVEAARRLMAEEAFAAFSSNHLEFIVPHLRPAAFSAGAALCRRGEPLGGAWVALDGAFGRDDGEADARVAGEEIFQGARRAARTVTAKGRVRALFLPASAMRRCAEVFPDLGLALLARKLAP